MVISSKPENVLTTMHAVTERGKLIRFIHSNLKEGKIIMLLVVEVAAFCSGDVEQVNKNLKKSCANVMTLHYHLSSATET
jgi:hypothetical protein